MSLTKYVFQITTRVALTILGLLCLCAISGFTGWVSYMVGEELWDYGLDTDGIYIMIALLLIAPFISLFAGILAIVFLKKRVQSTYTFIRNPI